MVVFGGRSEIGFELALRLAPGATVILTTRHGHSLNQQVSALRAAGAAEVHVKAFDADDLTSHAQVLDEILTEHGPIGTAVLAFGLLGDQARAEDDVDHAVAVDPLPRACNPSDTTLKHAGDFASRSSPMNARSSRSAR